MLNRRNFVGTGIATAALAAASTGALALPGDNIRYAMSGNEFGGMQPYPEEGIKMTAYYGYHGIEPFDNAMRKFIDKDPKEFGALLDAVGLQLCTIGCTGEYLDNTKFAESRDSNLKHARFVKALGGDHLKINLTMKRPDPVANMTTEQLRIVAANLDDLGQRTADIGIKLGFHPHCWTLCERTVELDYLMEHTNPKYVHLVFDPGHATLGGIDPIRVMNVYYSRLAAMHLKDCEAKYNYKTGWRGPAPSMEEHDRVNLYKRLGSGGVDFPEIFRILRRNKYVGWATLDFSAPRKGEGTVQDDMNRHKKYLLETLRVDMKHI